MTDIILASLRQTDVGEHWDIGLRELAFTAIEAALKDQTPWDKLPLSGRACWRSP